MTDEERQRQMDLVIETLVRITWRQEHSDLERKADVVRISTVEDAVVALTRLVEKQNNQT